MRILMFCLCISCCFGCTKNIHLDLSLSNKQYVIQGVISNRAGDCRVSVSEDQDFNDTTLHEGISGAVVTITGDNGLAVTLTESTPGIYSSISVAGHSGSTYKLSVEVNGNRFTASSTMPMPVSLDGLYIIEENTFGESRKIAHVLYTDPAGKGNNYRFVEYVKGYQQSPVFLRNDDINDGGAVDNELLSFNNVNDNSTNNRKIQNGDSVKVVMQCIDESVYKFWYSLDQSASGAGQAAPANPVSNIAGGAYGYFSAQSVQEKSLIVQ